MSEKAKEVIKECRNFFGVHVLGEGSKYGGSHILARLLKSHIPEAVLHVNVNNARVATEVDGVLYGIEGEIKDPENYEIMSDRPYLTRHYKLEDLI